MPWAGFGGEGLTPVPGALGDGEGFLIGPPGVIPPEGELLAPDGEPLTTLAGPELAVELEAQAVRPAAPATSTASAPRTRGRERRWVCTVRPPGLSLAMRAWDAGGPEPVPLFL